MKKLLLLFSLLILFSFKQKEETVSGTLYFKMIEFVNIYGLDAPREMIFNKFVSEMKAKKKPSAAEKEFIAQVDYVKQAGLEKTPYIKLENTEGKVLLIFMEEADYKQFSGYNLKELQAEKKKVEVSLTVTKLKSLIYKCNKVIAADKVNGETPWDK